MRSRRLCFCTLLTLALACLLSAQPLPFADAVNELASLRPDLPVIPERRFLLTDFGAVGDGRTLNTEAFRKAIEAVKAAGGGHLIVPKGVFRTLGFSLCSRLDLHLEEGAVIQAPDSFADYGLPDPSTLHSQQEVKEKVPAPRPFITGEHLQDVSLTGTGAIDGAGALWWAWSERAERAQKGRLVYRRAHLVVISGCERLLVADIILRNSPMFHLVPRDVTDLTIERVRVRAPFNAPNTDAIDPGPVTRAWIHHCDIDTGDDDIVIKSGCDRVLIEDCRIAHGHGISVGSGTDRGVRNMLVRNCTLEGTDNGLRIKSMIGAGGPVENIVYRGIRMRDVENAILLDLNYVDNNRPDFRGDPAKVPSIRNVLFEDIVIEASPRAGRIVGLPQSRITGLVFRNVSIGAEKDLVIRDADEPLMVNVTKAIAKGAAKQREHIIE